MSKLSKLKSFLNALKFVAGPVLIAAGVPPVIVQAVEEGMALAEKVSDETPKTNADKKAIAMSAAHVAIQTANQVKPETLDEAAILDTVSHGIDATIGTVNLINKKKDGQKPV